ncbi:LOW QUALITY PROTEIN: probable histone chaperone ASF1A [Phalaenopsis equestris]|uniref:LOW QUALITY PROTEIN: probable histone chaperone ASF1A n=1 Tax=Phalaenopsis equestris TaxID=78828 RepID=UPI0009E3B1B9|nr:LOW QUALITY PROTEIN: probable histone chaperone ASF1A [Phalaenopsis equestris]
MSAVNITNVAVLDNPAAFLNPFQFEISYECLVPLTDDLEWKLIYVGSAEDEKYDQLLESVLVGPVNVGNYRFVFQADPPDPSMIREEDILGVTVLLLTCSFVGQEFIRVGYYVNNDYDDEQLREEPPTKVLIDRVQRNILADKPRVTKFPINFHPDSNENGVQPAVNPSPEAINGDELVNEPELEMRMKLEAGVQPGLHPSPDADNGDGHESRPVPDSKKIEV